MVAEKDVAVADEVLHQHGLGTGHLQHAVTVHRLQGGAEGGGSCAFVF